MTYCPNVSENQLNSRRQLSVEETPGISPLRVEKIPDFKGRLPERPLYVYLPSGYDENPQRFYPVVYMHDGQNCFQSYVEDSFVGSWKAGFTADELAQKGLMRQCVIVGIGHGEARRMEEYLPPYLSYSPERKGSESAADDEAEKMIHGKADHTLEYYIKDIAPYVNTHYRILQGPENTAVCGSSMGGLFTAHIALEAPDFANNYAIISPSFQLSRTKSGQLETVERLRNDLRQGLRIWLDSGTQSAPGYGTDNMHETRSAYEALREKGYKEGSDFQYFLDDGAGHNEEAWGARLPKIFQFLFPHR